MQRLTKATCSDVCIGLIEFGVLASFGIWHPQYSPEQLLYIFSAARLLHTGVSYEGMSTPEREAKIQARKEEEEIRKEFRRVAVVAVYGSV